MQVIAENTRPQVRGVIDTISAGYNLVSRHPWLITIPVMLDIMLWAGPRLGVGPLVADFLRATAATADVGPEYTETVQVARDSLTALSQTFNLLGLLAAGFLGVPTIIGGGAVGRDLLPTPPQTFELTTWLALPPVALVLLLASVWIAAGYLAPIAQTVRDGAVTPATAFRNVWMAGWRLTVWVGVLIGLAVVVGVPAMLLAGLLMVLNAGVASFFSGILWISLMWVALYMFFVVESITVGQAGAFRSIWNSLNVVRWNLSPALGLVILVNVIQQGLPLVWQSIAGEAWGLPICIVGNAFVGTGLMAACMIFFRERFALWQSWLRLAEARRAAATASAAEASGKGARS